MKYMLKHVLKKENGHYVVIRCLKARVLCYEMRKTWNLPDEA
jgi:hypothetical protein